jgi:hypothetical protein
LLVLSLLKPIPADFHALWGGSQLASMVTTYKPDREDVVVEWVGAALS